MDTDNVWVLFGEVNWQDLEAEFKTIHSKMASVKYIKMLASTWIGLEPILNKTVHKICTILIILRFNHSHMNLSRWPDYRDKSIFRIFVYVLTVVCIHAHSSKNYYNKWMFPLGLLAIYLDQTTLVPLDKIIV